MHNYIKADVFMDEPVINLFIDMDDLKEHLNKDLDVKPGDNLVLLTEKICADKRDVSINDYKFYPNDVHEVIKEQQRDFNHMFGNLDKEHYFNAMITAEIVDCQHYDELMDELDYSATTIIYTLINIGNIDMDSLKAAFAQSEHKYFFDIEYDSVFIQDKYINGKLAKKPFRNRVYVEPIENPNLLISTLNEMYQKDHKFDNGDLMDENGWFVSERPSYCEKLPVWRINPQSDNRRDVQYIQKNNWADVERLIGINSHRYLIPSAMWDKYYKDPWSEIWAD